MIKIEIQTKEIDKIKKIFQEKFKLPRKNSHKGENGKLLIIGGSSLFHAASIWSAEVASHFVDMVHFFSTKENQKIFLKLKTIFRNGIIVSNKFLENYINEDNVILIGSGMIRDENLKLKDQKIKNYHINDIFKLKNEGKLTYFLTKYLLEKYRDKNFVFDAGALQMMDKDWLLKLKKPAIITPHIKEFENIFGINLANFNLEEKEKIIFQTAKKYQTVILFKNIQDIISDGETVYTIFGGNQGLTKGGTGDVLASLTSCFYVNHSALNSALLSSILLKITADKLFQDKGYWYNVSDIINFLPKVLKLLTL